MSDTPNIDDALFPGIDKAALLAPVHINHPPRILILYGSLRPRSFSRLSGEEAAIEDENRRLKRMFADLGIQADLLNCEGERHWSERT